MSDSGVDPRPIIVLSASPAETFQPRGGGNPHTARPTRERQAERLDSAFDELQRVADGLAQPSVTAGIPDGDPELVVVFEVVDSTPTQLSDAFRTAGLEPLLDIEGDIDDDQLGVDFARLRTPDEGTEPVKRFVHAAMANEAAVSQLLALWARWKNRQRMPSGFGDFRPLFEQLHAVRRWEPIDRVRATGLDELLAEALASGDTEVPLNIELFYRASADARATAEQLVRDTVLAANGTVHKRSERAEIGYHALAVTLPLDEIAPAAGLEVAALDAIALLRAPQVLFVRPGGQRVPAHGEGDELPAPPAASMPPPSGPPLIAILDGLPAANHSLLRGRVEIIDPDDLGGDATYTVQRRVHGTMVASAVVWGDLGASEPPASRPVVVRPVLRPDSHTVNQTECIPWEDLPPDLTIRAVRDVLADNAAPSVKVFNLSLGDPFGPFDTIPSAWARAVDWLSFEHNVLFVISAGNHLSPIPLDFDAARSAVGPERSAITSAALRRLSSRRRLLPPAESLNALTVGALHSDAAGDGHPLGYNLDLWDDEPGHPSPVSAHGRGIRRSIKPDLAIAGGRQVFSERFGEGGAVPRSGVARPPGVQVAAPPDRQAFVAGTTFAAAEVSRRAGRIIEVLDAGSPPVPPEHLAVATKALLVHGTTYPTDFDYGFPLDRMFGHGTVSRDLSAGCLPSQATLLFTGRIGARQRMQIEVPFPSELSGLTELRRVRATLAWFSPVNWNHRQYRRAKLTVDGPAEMSGRTRNNIGPDYQLTHRGTVQHRCFETERAYTADVLTFVVSCADQAGGLEDQVNFALAVTLEVGQDVVLDVYELVLNRLRAQARIRS